MRTTSIKLIIRWELETKKRERETWHQINDRKTVCDKYGTFNICGSFFVQKCVVICNGSLLLEPVLLMISYQLYGQKQILFIWKFYFQFWIKIKWEKKKNTTNQFVSNKSPFERSFGCQCWWKIKLSIANLWKTTRTSSECVVLEWFFFFPIS